MKKTIKYGGAALSAATAALAMGGSAFAAEPIKALTLNEETCAYTAEDSEVTDESVAKEQVAAYKAQVSVYNDSMLCYYKQAEELADKIMADSKTIGIQIEDDLDLLGDTVVAKLNSNVFSDVNDFADAQDDLVAAFDYDAEEGEKSVWERAVEANPYLNEDGIFKAIMEDTDDTYGQDEIIAEFNKAKTADQILQDIDAFRTLANKIDAEAKKADAAAKKAEAVVDEANEAAKAAQDEADDEYAAAKAAVEAAKEVEGVDAETIEALEAALEAAKSGETVDLTEVVAKANALVDEYVKAAEDYRVAENAAQEKGEAVTEAKKAVADAAKTLTSTYDYETELTDELLAEIRNYVEKDAPAGYEEIHAQIAELLEKYDEAAKKLDEAEKAELDANKAATAAQAKATLAFLAAEPTMESAKAVKVTAEAIKTAAESQAAANKAAAVAEAAADEFAGKTDDNTGEDDNKSDDEKKDDEKKDDEKPSDETPSDDKKDDEKPSDDKKDDEKKTSTYAVYSDSLGLVYSDGQNLTFHFDAEPVELLEVYVDGALIIYGQDYTVEEGSTKIVLANAFLDTLQAGEHTLKAVWVDDNETTVAFAIAEAEVEVETPDTGAATSEGSSAVASLVTTIMTATMAGAAVILRKRSA